MRFTIILVSVAAYFGNAISSEIQIAKCGVPAIKPDTTTNIVGGKNAIPYSWPWQIGICFYNKDNSSCDYNCGGSLISAQWILTAAHCITAKEPLPSQWRVMLGLYNRTNHDEPGEQVLEIAEFFKHPKFSFDEKTAVPLNDVALLKLKIPLKFTDHISPVCLPKKQDEDLLSAGTTLFLTGWGMTTRDNNNLSTQLQQVSVPLVAWEKCKEFLAGYVKNPERFEKLALCAGYEEEGKKHR